MEPTALVGRTLGRYLVRNLIGRGGMGVVYRADDLARRRAVALKTVSPEAGHDLVAAAHLMSEGRWLGCCRAPHIVQVFDSGQVDGVDFIAMELMASTLDARVAAGPASGDELIGIGSGMLLGLDAAHQEGILHCDIKPANVGISMRGTIKLLDFGVARPLPRCPHGHPTTTGSFLGRLVGTVPYMAPEQLRGDAVDECADVYSVGAVLYELATGRPPFCEHGMVCLIDAVLHAAPMRPSSLNPAIASDMEDVLLTALAKSPSERFQSAQDMLEGLLDTSPMMQVHVSPGALQPGQAPELRC